MTACAVCATIVSTGGKFHRVSDFTKLHALTLAARSYALLMYTVYSEDKIPRSPFSFSYPSYYMYLYLRIVLTPVVCAYILNNLVIETDHTPSPPLTKALKHFSHKNSGVAMAAATTAAQMLH